jgi:MraZ protein
LSFTGEYRHTIDTKGRLIVPSRLRDELVEGRVVLTTWPDGCIALWSGEGWQEFEAKLLTQRAGSQNNRKVVRTFAASAFTDEVDRQGRISVPSHLRAQAGIDKDVVVVGALDHAELWAPDRLDLGRAEMDELNELVEGMSF